MEKEKEVSEKVLLLRKIMDAESGVTLITLVVTIIILLIVLSVSVGIGASSIKQARDNKLITELGILNHAVLERHTRVGLTGEAYPGVVVTEVGKDVDAVLQEISSKSGQNITRKDNNTNHYYYVTNENGGLKSLGINDAVDEYIVNYHTGEVINYTQKITSTKVPLYIYSIVNTVEENKEDNTTIEIRFKDKNSGSYFTGGRIEIYSDESCNHLILEADIEGERYRLEKTLEPGNYYVKVTKAPDRYNTPKEILAYSVIENTDNVWDIEIIPGTALPSSGAQYYSYSIEKGLINIIASYQGTAIRGLQISLYKVASLDTNNEYVYESDFADYPTSLNDIIAAASSKEEAKKLVNYVKTEKIKPTDAGNTDEMGKLTFENLEKGIYMLSTGKATIDDKVFLNEPILVEITEGCKD